MAVNIDPVWPPIVTSVIAIAVGGLSVHFKLFIESDRDFRRRVEQHRTKITEKLAVKLAAVLQHVRFVVNTPDTALRGDGREEPDLVGELAEVTRSFSTTVYRLEIIRSIVRVAYFVLYLSIGCGLLGVLLAWTWEEARQYLLWFSIGLIAIQAVVVYGVMRASASLEVYEDVT